MQEEDKTKEQLLRELKELRQQVAEKESKAINKDGTVFPVFVDVSTVKDKRGNILQLKLLSDNFFLALMPGANV